VDVDVDVDVDIVLLVETEVEETLKEIPLITIEVVGRFEIALPFARMLLTPVLIVCGLGATTNDVTTLPDQKRHTKVLISN
jgi:hypothetical protein